MSTYHESLGIILKECNQALDQVVPETVDKFMDLLLSVERIFFVGTGRVQLSLRSMAARFRHLGLETYHVGQTGEPPISKEDLLIVGSGSGESLFPVAIAKKANQIGVCIVHIGSNSGSSLQQVTNLFVRIPAGTKLNLADEIHSEQPMTSLFEQSILIFGDVVANMLMQRMGLKIETLWERHANLE